MNTLREPTLILDESICVVFGNHIFCTVFDVTHEAILGKSFYELGGGEWDIPALRLFLAQIIPGETVLEGYEVKYSFEKLGPRIMILNARTMRFNDANSNIILSISDVTDQRAKERNSERLMLQKDTLLKEMRHRIANSLQLIASIIFLKAGDSKSEEVRLQLEDAHDRIVSIATIQRNLDPSSEGSLVPINDYLTVLCASLTKSMIGGRKPITIKVTGSAGTLVPDEAIALGLITTELVMNALKHAFPGGEGQIAVSYESDGTHWKLGVGDDGVGLRATTHVHNEGLGTNIIESLANQLNATVQWDTTLRGTVVSIVH
jgi:chemotaxis protein methyltransferase CheR